MEDLPARSRIFRKVLIVKKTEFVLFLIAY